MELWVLEARKALLDTVGAHIKRRLEKLSTIKKGGD